MWVKNGISFEKLQACMFAAIIVANEFCKENEKACMITSGNDGQHMANSLHYIGRALDFRTREMDEALQFKFVQYMRERLDTCYDIVLEKDHLHVEYDENK